MSEPRAGLGLVPIHVGTRSPAAWDELEAAAAEAGEQASPWLRSQVRPAILTHVTDWSQLGLEPRWLAAETSDCAAAVDASIFSGQGADELERFLAGAEARGDVAVLVTTIGDLAPDHPRSALFRYDANVLLRGDGTDVLGQRLPAGTSVRLADGVDGPDRDLGVRLLQRADDHPWWALHLAGRSSGSRYGDLKTAAPEGTLVPILVGPLDEPVVAYWLPPDRTQRWYLVPAGIDWVPVLDWLARQLLPGLAPQALRRARSPLLADPELMTPEENGASEALRQLEGDYLARRRQLQDRLAAATASATPIREGLLFGTGDPLKEAVAAVLDAAGCQVIDLDAVLGGTKSADLLVSYAGASRLVEVKSAPGRPGERLVDDLLRHLSTWPNVGHPTEVDGGTLVINHDHRLPPAERPADVYTRPEFVASLTVAVVSTGELYDHWRRREWSVIQSKVVGISQKPDDQRPGNPPSQHPSQPPPPANRRRWWRRSAP